eukprot:m.68630 g.68630  ORF g.68630 m.68630 type:complete len:486 (+) comp8248_c0_seq1:36-1493(+)
MASQDSVGVKKKGVWASWLLFSACVASGFGTYYVANNFMKTKDGEPNYIASALPFFNLLMLLEWILLRLVKDPPMASKYNFADTWGSLGAGESQRVFISFSAVTFERVIAPYFGYVWLNKHLGVTKVDDTNPVMWALVLLVVDFEYYWMHRLGHTVSIFWAGHQVHHSSEHYNLGTALRQSWWQYLTGALLELPFAFFVPPHMWFICSSWNTLYQFWVHTCLIDRLGPIEWIFSTPSHHRVHHDRRVHKNYGGILIIWDRIFGTFVDEYDNVCEFNYSRDNEEIILYGITDAVDTWTEPIIQFTGFRQALRKVIRSFHRSRKNGDSLIKCIGAAFWALRVGPGYATTLKPRKLKPPMNDETRLRFRRPVSTFGDSLFMFLQIAENFVLTTLCIVGVVLGVDAGVIVLVSLWFYFNTLTTSMYLDKQTKIFHYLLPIRSIVGVVVFLPFLLSSLSIPQQAQQYFYSIYSGLHVIYLILQCTHSLSY